MERITAAALEIAPMSTSTCIRRRNFGELMKFGESR